MKSYKKLVLLTVMVAVTHALPAAAQIRIQLGINGESPANCVATTNGAGVYSIPNSVELAASGVTIAGTCAGGSGPPSFGTTIYVPPTATVNTQVDVNWMANTQADICVFGRPTEGVVNWPAGQVACRGSSYCHGAHVQPVLITQAGTYVFEIVCTNNSGFAEATIQAH